MNAPSVPPPPTLKREGLYSYQQRLIGWAMLPLALALVALTMTCMYWSYQRQTEFTQRQLDRMAEEIDDNLRQHIQGLKALAALSVIPSALRTREELHQQAMAYQQAAGVPVLLAESDRSIWLSSARDLNVPLPNLPDAPGQSALEVALLSGKPAISNLVMGSLLGAPVVSIVMPVRELPGRKAWITSLPAALWQGLVDKKRLSEGWTLVVLDGNGKIIGSRGDHVQEALQSSSGGGRFEAQSLMTPWMVVSYAPPWVFYQPQIRLGLVLVVILGVVYASALWLTRRSSRKLHAAIAQLSNSAITAAPAGGPIPRIFEVEAVHEELRRLRVAEHEAESKERQRMARELHDGLQQYLAASQMSIEVAYDRVGHQDTQTARLLRDSLRNSRHVVEELHHIINNLRPAALTHLGLLDALDHMVQSVSRRTGLLIELEVAGPGDALHVLPEDISDCLYRAVQECLNNVRKHAQASFVHVLVDVSDPRTLMLQVSDDGVGWTDEARAHPEGFGLAGMQQRVGAMGGSLEVERGHDGDPTRGTTVRARCPLA